MKCPICKSEETKVIDSRPTEEGYSIRRRRECEKCKKRFTTYEKREETIVMIVKKDGSRESFDRSKVMNGVIKACEKRPVTMESIEKMVDNIERGINNMTDREVASTFIGELTMEGLRNLDEVAYVRFASVYRQFTDVGTFVSEIEELLKRTRKEN
ncbi:MAG: transcriptional regulator NrdR [Anaerovoracaceae bacterium]